MVNVIVVTGKPGSGKGSRLSDFLEENKEEFSSFSTGDILRSEIQAETELGLKAKGYMDAGKMVPDDLINDIVFDAINKAEKTIILDGYPRTTQQAETMLSKGIIPQKVIDISVDDDQIVERLSSRVVCPICKRSYSTKYLPRMPKLEGICDKCKKPLETREDDKPETVKNRLLEYEKKTLPILDILVDAGIELIILNGNTADKDITEKFNSAMKE